MDIQHSTQDLLNKLIKLTISSVQAEPARRQSNTLIAVDMPSQIIPTHIEQYNKLYLSRLAILSKRIPLHKVYKVQAVEEKLGVIDIIGIFKRIQFKRVRAFEKEYEQYYGSGKKIYDQKDTLELEDATGKLKFTLSPNCTMNGRPVICTDLPYGVVIGLTGKNDDEKMQFVVQKITLPNSPPQKPFIFQQYSQPRKTLVISSPSIQQIQETLYEICSIANFQIYNTIKSLIIMGFSQKLNAKDYKRLDEIFGKYQQSIDIFVMPNQKQTDIYPQRPVHPILFSKSYKKMSLVSNPQIFYPNSDDEHPDDIQVENLSGSILVCSGQNIKDLIKNCSYGNSSLDSMESILQYSHLAPTSPFSLKCSMMPEDFLVLKELPHIFIAGGITQETMMRDCNFKSGKVKLIGIKNGESVLIDIDSHEVQKFYICSAAAELGIF